MAVASKRNAGNPLGVKRGTRLVSRRTWWKSEVIGFTGSGRDRRAKLRSDADGRVRTSLVRNLDKNFRLA